MGASAALAGLVFVGISINLRRVIALPVISHRAFQALLILSGSLGIESLLLAPGQSTFLQGLGVLAVAVVLWAALNWLEGTSWRIVPRANRARLEIHTITIQIPSVLAFVGALLLPLANPSALYWMVPATLTSILGAMLEAWVITVEILR
ncbi:MAG: hypothetical protein WB778_10140 [Thermoplasmata archaeon]